MPQYTGEVIVYVREKYSLIPTMHFPDEESAREKVRDMWDGFTTRGIFENESSLPFDWEFNVREVEPDED